MKRQSELSDSESGHTNAHTSLVEGSQASRLDDILEFDRGAKINRRRASGAGRAFRAVMKQKQKKKKTKKEKKNKKTKKKSSAGRTLLAQQQ